MPWYPIQGDEAVRKIKAEFDDAYGPSWHVFVGKHFGSKVTHDSKMFTFFYLEASAVVCLLARENPTYYYPMGVFVSCRIRQFLSSSVDRTQ